MSSSEKKPNIFETISALSSIRPLTYRDIREQNLPYEPFLVNRAFSLSEDSVRAAALMNERFYLDNDMQATFYIHTLRPKRRFEKWPKQLNDEEVTLIAQYYGISLREAKYHKNLHTKEQITAMKEVLKDGARPTRYR